MSAETWLKKYYPETAEKAAERGELAAVEHSLRKWRGLRPAVLKRHGLKRDYLFIRDPDRESVLEVDSESCALCVRHSEPSGIIDCEDCSLCKVRGYVSCTDYRHYYREVSSPYGVFTSRGDPEPMIKWLEKAKKFVQAEPPASRRKSEGEGK